MNLLCSLPDEIQDKIWNEVHKIYLKDVHIEIKYGWPLCRKLVYKHRIYTRFLNSKMSNESLKVFNEYLDYKNGKLVYLPRDNIYIEMDLFIF
jgi:hypothetical protein